MKVTNIAKTCDFMSEKLSAIERKVKLLEEETDKLNAKAKETETSIHTLQEDLNKLERFSRRNNIRIMGFDEEEREDTLEKVDGFLNEYMQHPDMHIERAHRVGRRVPDGKPRQMIVKLLRYTDKITIMKEAKKRLQGTPFRIVDDLTKKDLIRKNSLRPVMNEAYTQGKKVRYNDGRLYIDNQLYRG